MPSLVTVAVVFKEAVFLLVLLPGRVSFQMLVYPPRAKFRSNRSAAFEVGRLTRFALYSAIHARMFCLPCSRTLVTLASSAGSTVLVS